MQAADKASELVNITRDIIAAIHQFEGLLKEESEALEKADNSSLVEIAERKNRYADHLDQLVRTRARTLANLGIEEGRHDKLADTVHDNNQLRVVTRDWDEALHTLKNCQRLNEQAGALIQAQSQRARRGLEILTGASASTYGPEGKHVEATLAHKLGTA